MSELTAINLNSMGCYNINEPIYLKSEADKVFRRLKARLARKGISNQQLEADKNHNWRKYCTAMTELRHHKYHRCLDKVALCENKIYNIMRIALRDMDEHTLWQYEDDFWQRWDRRWLELAEKLRP